MSGVTERVETFPCFGTTVSIRASGEAVIVRTSLATARAVAEDVHARLTRFDRTSELCRLNDDPRERVPCGALLRRFAAAVRWAGQASDGLVDATCLPAVEAAGYRTHWTSSARGPAWRGADPAPCEHAWESVRVEHDAVRRPPGTRLDSGGLGKGLAADLMAAALGSCSTWAVDCGGDLRVGGREPRVRTIEVRGPFDERAVHRIPLKTGAVATSGTTRRAWPGGHHLIDPRTGRPAATGIAQVTALAATGLEAEVRAKAALLAGPERAERHLPAGGAYVTADGRVRRVSPASEPRRRR